MSNINEIIYNLQLQIKNLEQRMEQEEVKHKDAIEKLRRKLVEHEEYMASKLRVLDYHTLLR